MIYLIIKTTILSIFFIFIVHNIIFYFKDNLTIPKTKDLIMITEKKYDDIHKTLNLLTNFNNNNTTNKSYINETTLINELPKPSLIGNMYESIDEINNNHNNNNSEYSSTNNMKDELKFFIKQHQL
jgi:hypothetical protein